ncbi:MAG: glycosyltransferase family 4 protein, partial [Terriglobia bacterium]
MRQPATIAFVSASLDILGGHGIQTKALMGHLRSNGYRTYLVPINPRFPIILGWLRKVPYARTILNEFLYILTLPRLMRADVVHVCSASYFSFLLGPVPALVCAWLMRKRVILNYRSGEAEDHLAHWGVLVHPFLRLADEIVVPSPFLHDVFARFGYETRVIENIVDTSTFCFHERVPLRLRLLSARNLEPHYRVGDIIEAFVLLRKKHPEARLVIAGSGSEEHRLHGLAESLGAEGIDFVGRYQPSQAPELYANADIFVNAAVIDNQPNSILEAFASGLPVVST